MFSKYRYVYAIYREGNFTKAAQKLFISQPSLSVAIQNIEKKVGAPLFDRSGAKIELTEIGREYIAAAEQIIRTEQEFSKRIHDIYGLETGELSVGGTNYLCSYVLPRIMNRFASRYPKINVTLVEGNSENLRQMIEREELDIVIDSFEEDMQTLRGFPLVSEKILLCVPSERPINRELMQYRISPDSIYSGAIDLDAVSSVPIQRFQNEDFVLLKSGNDMFKRAMKIFNNGNVTPRVQFSVDQLNISFALAESGMASCFATDTLFKYGVFHDHVALYRVGEEHGNRMLYIAHKKNRYCTTAMSEFIRMAVEEIHQ